MKTIISTKNLSKEFDSVPILNNISLEINKGEIIGLLGENGTGKTTILKLLSGLLEPTEGQITINSYNPWIQRDKVLNSIGIMIETPVFYEHLTAYENIEIHLNYMNAKTNIDEILKIVGLSNLGKKTVSKFSMGMKQRLGIARAISHSPAILLLDEPINGLDPIAIKDIRELFIKLKEKGMTIILSSHILAEILQTAETIFVISNNKLKNLGKVSDLEREHQNEIENFLIERMRD